MDPTADDLAGIVDLFGALARPELRRALSELAFKRGTDVAAETFADDVEAALESYHLLSVPAERVDASESLLVVGPTAFPTLPEGAADLPHIMDVDRTPPDEDTRAAVAEERFAADVEAALASGDRDRIETLLDVSYELSVWGGVDVEAERERLTAADA